MKRVFFLLVFFAAFFIKANAFYTSVNANSGPGIINTDITPAWVNSVNIVVDAYEKTPCASASRATASISKHGTVLVSLSAYSRTPSLKNVGGNFPINDYVDHYYLYCYADNHIAHGEYAVAYAIISW